MIYNVEMYMNHCPKFGHSAQNSIVIALNTEFIASVGMLRKRNSILKLKGTNKKMYNGSFRLGGRVNLLPTKKMQKIIFFVLEYLLK